MDDFKEGLTSLIGAAELFAIGLITIGIDMARRWAKRRMDIWEAEHPAKPRPNKGFSKAADDDVDDDDADGDDDDGSAPVPAVPDDGPDDDSSGDDLPGVSASEAWWYTRASRPPRGPRRPPR